MSKSRWCHNIAGREIDALGAASTARKRGQARDPWATVEELLAERGGEDDEAWRGREITPGGQENEQSGQG